MLCFLFVLFGAHCMGISLFSFAATSNEPKKKGSGKKGKHITKENVE